MRSTFFFREHPNHAGETGVIEADYVTFERDFVVFHQEEILSQPHRIIKAVHSSACHDLREVINEQ